MERSPHLKSLVFALLAPALALLLAPGAHAASGLPARAIAVEGGMVSVVGGIMADDSRPSMPFGKMKYPTTYFFFLENETPSDLWAEVGFKLEEDKKEKHDSGKIEAGKTSRWSWPSFDVPWGEPVSVHITIFRDKKQTEQLAESTMTMMFDESEKETFHHPPKPKEKGATVLGLISGWPEMGASNCAPEGTVADKALKFDICNDLWKKESIRHTECKHPIVAVKPMDMATSALLAKQPDDFRGRAEAFHAKGDLNIEVWSVKSCDDVTDYEVMMIKAPQGGTDFSTAPVEK